MPLPKPEYGRNGLRILLTGAAMFAAPKCVLCLAAYSGLGAALGWTGAELCGAPEPGPPWIAASVLAGSVTLAVGSRRRAPGVRSK